MNARRSAFATALLLSLATRAHAQSRPTTAAWLQRVHDPAIIRQGATYYLFSTGPGVSLRTSTDLLTWSL